MRLTTLLPVLFICFTLHKGIFGEYYGKFIGTVVEVDVDKPYHNFTGELYAVNDTSVGFVKLTYDGKGPAARFWVANKGEQRADNSTGYATKDEHGSDDKLKKYDKDHIILTLPGEITLYSSLAIYCPRHNHNFGQVPIPDDFELPKEQTISPLAEIKHGVKASEVILKDSATIELQDFHYDGQGNDVYFAVGPDTGATTDELTKLLDENGNPGPLEEYTGKTVALRLPKMKHWNDYKWFTVYSFGDNENLGDVEISQSTAESLPWYNWGIKKRTTAATPAPKVTPAATQPKPSSNPPPPPASRPSSPDSNKSEGK
ncbi:protein Skeletor, isoforms B/C-like [Haemaphysalis longicornis]